MIDSLHGNILKVTPTHTVLECGGVGYLCHITKRTYNAIHDCTRAFLEIQSVFRDGKGTELFGFSCTEEKDLFNLLTGHVSGVGPKTAISLLNAISPEHFRNAVVENQPEVIASGKGIGKKTAERIVLELRDKIKVAEVWEAKAHSENPSIEDATLALISLGHSKNSSEKAVKAAAAKLTAPYSPQDLIREALQNI